jgi:hypothetical protein
MQNEMVSITLAGPILQLFANSQKKSKNAEIISSKLSTNLTKKEQHIYLATLHAKHKIKTLSNNM